MTRMLAPAVVATVAVVWTVTLCAADSPETVMVTFRPKPGAADALARVIQRHYETARTLQLLRADAPHVTLKGVDADGQTYFVEIFTWRDHAVPDSAPNAILKIWEEMNNLVESRPGRPGLTFTEMSTVAP